MFNIICTIWMLLLFIHLLYGCFLNFSFSFLFLEADLYYLLITLKLYWKLFNAYIVCFCHFSNVYRFCVYRFCFNFVPDLDFQSYENPLLLHVQNMKIYKDEEKKTDFYKLWLSNSTISNNASNEVFFFSSQKYYCNWFPKRP